MKEIPGFKISSSVCQAIFVDKQRKIYPRFFAKDAGVICIAQADGRQTGSSRFKFRFVFAQLRDMLAAEDSAIVPEEHNDGRILLPKGIETYFGAGGVGQHNGCQPLRKRCHGISIPV